MHHINLLLFLIPFTLGVPAPHPQLEEIPISPGLPLPTIPLPLSTSLNIPITAPTAFPSILPPVNITWTSRRRWSHWEPIPIFSKSCDCPNLATVARPCWVTDALMVSPLAARALGTCLERGPKVTNFGAEGERERA
ncbi:hypothetical protein M011DRAFT_114865 [Sporormia fimetaria CBS 119925]|uniref:Uncharacterized protein n=1 Tax=Sporormia fimetaria CBS 119925 TaxID=1340428 RepID=A0A6A6VNX6_9PLEO|nr:hypothetical protein M011DRAFT_114865 [Sporormia fimetaria CBS 119925]